MFKYTKIIISIFLFTQLIIANDTLDKAMHLYETEKYEEAEKLFQKLIDKNGENAELFFYLGKCQLKLQKIDSSIDNLLEATELNDKSAEYFYWYATALTAKAMNSNFFTAGLTAPKVKKAFKKAVKLDSNMVKARIGLAQYYIMAPGILGGDLELGKFHINKIIKKDKITGNMILIQYYLKSDKPDSSLNIYKFLEKEIGNDSSKFYFYNNYGYFLLEQKKYDLAIEKLKKQVELAPDKANSYDSLGDGYRVAGNIENAIKAYRTALQIDPNFKASKEKLKKMEN